MGKVLSGSDIESYRKSGIHFPLRAFSTVEAGELAGKAESTKAMMGGKFAGR